MEPLEEARLAGANVVVRHCTTLEEYEECVRLERAIWGEDIVVPAAIFVVAGESGGQTLGAFAGKRLAGFTLGLAGFHGDEKLIHSHMTAVAPELRNRGIGRMLKMAQRAEALGRGIRLVEWTFDPLELKNAHFNLHRLGAVARRYIPNCYGVTESPLHAGLPTDRLVAEWRLDSKRVEQILAGKAPRAKEGAARISLPADISERKQTDSAAGAKVQNAIREQFLKLFQEGYAVTGIEIGARESHYILEKAGSKAGAVLNGKRRR